MRISSTADRFLVPYPRELPQARQRLFCFPFAGAGVSIFREWPSELRDDTHVFGIQLPGRENRIAEPPLHNLVAAARGIAEVLSRYDDLPFALFGHSLGALLCFEVARQLRNWKCSSPTQMFASACGAPRRLKRDMPIHELPDDLLIQKLRGFNGTPEQILKNEEVMQLMLPTIRADLELSETYSYEPDEPLECPITVVGGLQDHEVTSSDLLAWETETSASFNIRMFPGDHYFIRSRRTLVLRMIRDQLGSVPASRAAGGRS